MEAENLIKPSLLQRRNGAVSQTLDLKFVSGDEPLLPSYTSLKDILPTATTTTTTIDSPSVSSAVSAVGPTISIRNRLVKQAACAYLQPSTPTPSFKPSFLRRISSSLLRFFSAFVDSLLCLFPSSKLSV